MEINKADRILNSLNGLKKAEAPDFFYTRLRGRMQHEMEPAKRPFFWPRPVWVTSALVLLLVVNVFSFMQLNRPSGKSNPQSTAKPATLESFADAYNMNTSTVYE